MHVQQLPEGRLDAELAKVQQRRDPPIPVVAWLHLDGREWDGVLHGWSQNPNGGDDGWRGLVQFTREYAAGFWTEALMWVRQEDIRRR